MASVTFDDILAARKRIAGGVYNSPCPESIPLSELCGSHVFCKLDYLQRTGSFKERGARNALLLLSEQQRQRGVIAASAGNHALGLAYHGQLLGIRITVVMPRFAPLVKVTTCRRFGARVVLEGENFSHAKLHAEALAHRNGQVFIHGFNDPAVIAGQGTMAVEILEQVPQVDALIVPVGGAGLLAGVALAAKTIKPEIKIVAVEAANAPGFSAALTSGKPVETPVLPTLADGLAVNEVGDLAFEIARPRVDRVVTVSEEEISLAVLRLMELEKSVVEGAGAVPLAACMSGKLPELAGKNVVLLLCGGNIDLNVLDRIIERGLVTDGRLCRFTAVVSDRPGGLARVAQLIADTGGSIKDLTHDRAFSGADVTAVNVLCTVETSDRQHIAELYRRLRDAGVPVIPASQAVEVSAG
ncbi:MAG TPA: threonine ammonia-lyase [Pirellulales bacterium]|jgi:threonine dehydratase